LSTAELAQQLRRHYQTELANTPLPDDLCHHFDQAGPGSAHVRKTTCRQVVTLELSRFTAVEVVREADRQDKARPPPSALQALVPKGGRYGYDLIAHVGWQTFVKGRTLQDVAEDLQPLNIPFSSLHDVQMKFLFYLGHLHRQCAGFLRDYLSKRGSITWLIDSTLEPGTPLFFGIQDAEEDLMLGAWKIATESADVLVPCLKQASESFGRPARVLHDLSDAMNTACREAWNGMRHDVCHFHLVRDIGIDLLDEPQAALRDRVRQVQLQPRLKEQRNGQTDWLRQHVEDPTSLAQILAGGAVTVSPAVLGREVLMAFHQWVLDYASDGQRQGYPFDPYLLYFHRRVVRASVAVDRLLGDIRVQDQAPLVLKNFARMLREYLGDARVSEAAQQYEEAFALFCRVRDVLRLSSQGKTPLSDRYLLAADEAAAVRPLLEHLRQECRRASQEATAAWTRKLNQVVVDHLDRYWGRLFPEEEGERTRTTNGLEQGWRMRKRGCRKRHGRQKLTRDFQSLPAEFMLVGNLLQPRYVEIVLGGDINQLPRHLAEAGRTAGAWTKWRQQQQPLNTARLPQRLLRQENLIEAFVSSYHDHCQGEETGPLSNFRTNQISE
jgi:hypothetical protein